MFQPRVKLEFIRRYCNPANGWKVFVDIDPSEEGRTGGVRSSEKARRRQFQMKRDARSVRKELEGLGVTVGGDRRRWHAVHELPAMEGDRDVVAFNVRRRRYLVAEVEGASSGQPEQKLYKAIGQLVLAASCSSCDGWSRDLYLVVYGVHIAQHLSRATALKKLGITAVRLGETSTVDECLFGSLRSRNEGRQ